MSETDAVSLGHLACVVKAKFSCVEQESSTCGIILSQSRGIIITHGSILIDLCLKEQGRTLASRVTRGHIIPNSSIGQQSPFYALMDQRFSMTHSNKVEPLLVRNTSQRSVSEISEYSYSGFTQVSCKFIGAFRNDDFHNAMNLIMPKNTWSFTCDDLNHPNSSNNKTTMSENSEESNHLVFDLMSYFVLLKIDPVEFIPKGVAVKAEISMDSSHLKGRAPSYEIGDTAEIIATPFGSLSPTVFFNSYSRGVISNVSGKRNCWILSDARCIPGSEGGPLFIVRQEGPKQKRYLTGIITSSLCWKDNEWTGFSVACSMDSVMRALAKYAKGQGMGQSLDGQLLQLKSLSEPTASWNQNRSTGLAVADRSATLLSSTVLVRVRTTWGSGILVNFDRGIILTCSHVVKDAKGHPVKVTLLGSDEMHEARIVYRQEPLTRPFDLALLECPHIAKCLPNFGCKTPSIVSPVLGQDVFVVGHALFSSELGLSPSVSQGVVSKVISRHQKPVMVQTTCAVHPGASGGPLLDTDGQLVGIVVCNTKDNGTNSSFPHVNMSIPAVSVWSAVSHYVSSGDESVLSSLELEDETAAKLWALGNPAGDASTKAHRSRSKL